MLTVNRAGRGGERERLGVAEDDGCTSTRRRHQPSEVTQRQTNDSCARTRSSSSLLKYVLFDE